MASATMANTCLTSLPSLFTPKTTYPFSSLPSKQFKPLTLSSPSPLSWGSLKNKFYPPPLVAFVASTSDWDENPVSVAEAEVENGEDGLVEEDGSVEEGDGEDGLVEEDGSVEEGEFVDPPEDAKLFVGNLPYDVTSEAMAQLFEQAGTVEVSEVIYNRDTDQSRGFGFVWMQTIEEALKAIEMFNGYDLNGRYLTVNKAAPRGSRPERAPRTFEPSFRVYVGNLPWEVDDSRLEQVFSEHGKVVQARVVYDRETGRSRGFGFVSFSTQSEVNDAIEALDGQELEGRAIRVNVAEERPRRNSF